MYRGQRFPDLVGTYIFGDYETRRIWSARFQGEKLKSLTDLVRPSLRLVAFGEDTAHELLMLSYEDGTMRNSCLRQVANLNCPTTAISAQPQFPPGGFILAPNASGVTITGSVDHLHSCRSS